MKNRIFMIGPGGSGKSTVGEILSEIIGYKCIDLDTEFCSRIINIREYIKSYGYDSYLEGNSDLLSKLLEEYPSCNVVFILSSGFLSTDIRQDIVEKNKKLISESGFSVLFMPSNNYQEALECILSRQLNRGFYLIREKEEEKFNQRFYEYLQLGDLKVFSMEEPELIAAKIANELTNKIFTLRAES